MERLSFTKNDCITQNMSNIIEITNYISTLFDKTKLAMHPEECGFFVPDESIDVKKIAYSTNLNPHVIEKAVENDADLIISHHDAWNFIFGMKEFCHNELLKHNIAHAFIHAPLDDVDFGTNDSFLKELGGTVVKKTTPFKEVFLCGRIAVLNKAVDFNILVEMIESLLKEPVKRWKNHSRDIYKVGFVSGAGLTTTDFKEIVDENCDVYITGEKILFTVEYARFKKINLIVGSHTGTEIFGVESLVKRVSEYFNIKQLIRIDEHFETWE